MVETFEGTISIQPLAPELRSARTKVLRNGRHIRTLVHRNGDYRQIPYRNGRYVVRVLIRTEMGSRRVVKNFRITGVDG